MDAENTSVKGGLSILHKLLQGKHHYEVDRVVNYQKHYPGEAFVRQSSPGMGASLCFQCLGNLKKGDTILKINGQDLKDLTPEMFAELLTEVSPMLTVHQSSTDTPKGKCQEQRGMYPFNKEKTIMTFNSLEMIQKDEPEENRGEDDRGSSKGDQPQPGGGEDPPFGDNSGELDELLIVSMTKTSISIVKGRGCEAGSPCHDCGGTACNFNDVVMVSNSSNITLVSRGITNFLRERVRDNILIRSLVHDRYIHNRNRVATMSRQTQSNAEMSIYYYKSDCVDGEYPGSAVVLNFTGTECFLKCSSNDDKATLSIESCDKSKLKHITNQDEETWPFVFYMKASRDGSRRFESANCPGWFINAKNQSVALERLEAEDHTFFFIIRN